MLYPLSYQGKIDEKSLVTIPHVGCVSETGALTTILDMNSSFLPERTTTVAQHQTTFIDVQRRNIAAEIVTKDGVPVLSIDKEVPGGSSKRLLLLNKVDAQQLADVLDRYLKQVYSLELAGMNAALSPADMLALFGEDEDEA